jgi:hypothetical protein
MIIRQEFSSLRQGLVGAWCPSLGASGLTLIDRSGLNNHGTLTNMAGQNNWQASGSGVALSFDGSNDFARANHQRPISVYPVTLSAWMRSANLNTTAITPGNAFTPVMLSNTANLVNIRVEVVNIAGVLLLRTITQNAAGTVAREFRSTGFTSNSDWNHYCGVFLDGTTQQVYYNGVLQPGSAAGTEPTISGIESAYIGGFRYNTSLIYGSVNGLIDDCRIYNRALTLAEIRLLASRRGIGLTPLPDRAAGLPRKLSVNVGGTWRDGDAYVNTGSGWRLGVPFVNDAGTWR